MLVIFDLDYTLFDANEFKKGLAKKLGCSFVEYNEIYKKNFSDKKISYDLEIHLEIIRKQRNLDQKSFLKLKKELNNYLSDLNEFVFNDSEKLLQGLKDEGFELILVTYGNKKLQNRKIEGLKIRKYFSKIIFAEKDKVESLNFLKQSQKLKFLINDNARENLRIEKTIPKLKSVLVKGPYSENVEHNRRIYKLKDVLARFDFKIKKNKIGSHGLRFSVENQGQEVGRARFYLLKNDLHQRPFGFVEDVFINDEYRGEGLGTQLFEEILKEVKTNRCYKLIMTSRHSREKAHKLYEKLGFKDHGKEFRMDF